MNQTMEIERHTKELGAVAAVAMDAVGAFEKTLKGKGTLRSPAHWIGTSMAFTLATVESIRLLSAESLHIHAFLLARPAYELGMKCFWASCVTGGWRRHELSLLQDEKKALKRIAPIFNGKPEEEHARARQQQLDLEIRKHNVDPAPHFLQMLEEIYSHQKQALKIFVFTGRTAEQEYAQVYSQLSVAAHGGVLHMMSLGDAATQLRNARAACLLGLRGALAAAHLECGFEVDQYLTDLRTAVAASVPAPETSG